MSSQTAPARDLTIRARDGLELAATVYRPLRESGRAVVVAPATGVPRRFYGTFAQYLASRGLLTVTFDCRGMGDTVLPGGRRGRRRVRMHQWGELDAAGVLDWVHSSNPGYRILVLGHSAGGQLLGMAPNCHVVAGLLGVGAQSGDYRLWNLRNRIALWPLWHIGMPIISRTLGFFPGRLFGLGADLPAGVALEWAHWCRSPGYLTGNAAPPAQRHYSSFAGAVRAYAFTDDFFAPPRAVRAWLDFYPSARSTEYIEVRPGEWGVERIGHFDVFRSRFREVFWPLAVEWLESV